jgi:hypothetical protein
MSEQYIQFAANYDDWVAVKKLKVDEKTGAKTVMEFLAGLTVSVDRKIEKNLGTIVDLEPLKKHLASIEYGKKEAEIAHVLAFVNGLHTNRVIKEITAPLEEKGVQKNEIKEVTGFCKVFAMRYALKECQLNMDYSSVEIPGMKRLMKKKG